jgi:hypothetical protein
MVRNPRLLKELEDLHLRLTRPQSQLTPLVPVVADILNDLSTDPSRRSFERLCEFSSEVSKKLLDLRLRPKPNQIASSKKIDSRSPWYLVCRYPHAMVCLTLH